MTKISINKITIYHKIDESPDISYLNSTIDENGKINSCRYTQEDLDKHPIRTRRYIKEDIKRLNNFCETWYSIGIYAEAEVLYPIGTQGDFRIEHLRSGGLWGIESDSEVSYFKEVEQEQLSELKEHLETFGIDTSNFDEVKISTKEK